MELPYKRHYAGGLEIFEVPGKDIYGPHVILLHGYGANAFDLMSFCTEVAAPPNTTWIFPNGPIAVPFSEGYVGRAWFDIDIAELERNSLEGKPNNFSKICPKGLTDATVLVQELIKRLPVSSDQIVIGGFSQGAMVATDTALTMKETLAGLAVLSGSLLDQERWEKLAAEKSDLHFFQSHGAVDQLLGIAEAKLLEKLFSNAKMTGKLHLFDGGHSIPEDVIDSLGAFLLNRLETK